MADDHYPMQMIYRGSLLMLGALGLLALAAGVADLSGLSGDGNWLRTDSAAERWAAVVVGALLLPFVITALLHSRLELADGELRYLRFHLLCSTGVIRLDEIRRFGEGVHRHGRRRDHILALELDDGSRRSIKLNMYARGGRVPQRLAELLGREPSPTKVTWKGVALADEEPTG